MITTNSIPELIRNWAASIQKRDASLMTNFYTKDAILIGTYSEPIEVGKNEIYRYFKTFLNKQGLTCKIQSNINQILYCGLIISSGTYIFRYEGKEVVARYSFCLREHNGMPKIINHHSSEIPE